MIQAVHTSFNIFVTGRKVKLLWFSTPRIKSFFVYATNYTSNIAFHSHRRLNFYFPLSVWDGTISLTGPLGVSRYLVVFRSVKRDDRVGALALLVCLSALGPGILSPAIFSLIAEQACMHHHIMSGTYWLDTVKPERFPWSLTAQLLLSLDGAGVEQVCVVYSTDNLFQDFCTALGIAFCFAAITGRETGIIAATCLCTLYVDDCTYQMDHHMKGSLKISVLVCRDDRCWSGGRSAPVPGWPGGCSWAGAGQEAQQPQPLHHWQPLLIQAGQARWKTTHLLSPSLSLYLFYLSSWLLF